MAASTGVAATTATAAATDKTVVAEIAVVATVVAAAAVAGVAAIAAGDVTDAKMQIDSYLSSSISDVGVRRHLLFKIEQITYYE